MQEANVFFQTYAENGIPIQFRPVASVTLGAGFQTIQERKRRMHLLAIAHLSAIASYLLFKR